MTPTPIAPTIEPTLAEIERAAILDRLAALDGHRAMTARSLGISPRTLANRLREYKAAGIAVIESQREPEHVLLRTALEILQPSA